MSDFISLWNIIIPGFLLGYHISGSNFDVKAEQRRLLLQ